MQMPATSYETASIADRPYLKELFIRLGTLKTRELRTWHQVAGVENALAGELREFRVSDPLSNVRNHLPLKSS